MSEFKSAMAYQTFHSIGVEAAEARSRTRLKVNIPDAPPEFAAQEARERELALHQKMLAEVERLQNQLVHHTNAVMMLANAEREAACRRIVDLFGVKWLEERCSWATDFDRPLWIALRIDDTPVWESETTKTADGFRVEHRWLADLEQFR